LRTVPHRCGRRWDEKDASSAGHLVGRDRVLKLYPSMEAAQAVPVET
jgi:hypothetical protein